MWLQPFAAVPHRAHRGLVTYAKDGDNVSFVHNRASCFKDNVVLAMKLINNTTVSFVKTPQCPIYP